MTRKARIALRGSARKLYVLLALVGILLISLVSLRIHRSGWQQTLTALPRFPVTCPTDTQAILVMGQSHASNTGPHRNVAERKSYATSGSRCYRLRDPMPGTAGRGGSIWPGFADALDRSVTIADIAISGSAIEDWTTPDMLGKVNKTLAELRAAGFRPPLVIWMQGETDAARRTTADVYHSHLRRLLDATGDLTWLITRESVCYDIQTKWRALDEARDRLARENPNVHLGPDLDSMPRELRQQDNCHLTTQGQQVLGMALAESAKPLIRER
jgi:predicted membrane-bound mannosyltransferase